MASSSATVVSEPIPSAAALQSVHKTLRDVHAALRNLWADDSLGVWRLFLKVYGGKLVRSHSFPSFITHPGALDFTP